MGAIRWGLAASIMAMAATVAPAQAPPLPTVTIPFPTSVGVAPTPAAPAPAGSTTTVTVTLPPGGVAPTNQPFQIQPSVIVEVNLSQLGNNIEVTVPLQGGPISANPAAGTASIPVTWQVSQSALVAALQAKLAQLQLLAAALQIAVNGMAFTYVEVTFERAVLGLAMNQQLQVVNADIGVLQSVIAQVQAGNYSSVSASGFQVTQSYQGTLVVPPGPARITVTSTATTSGVNVPLV